MGMLMTAGPISWFETVNRALLYLFWVGLIPNVIYFIKYFKVENNAISFFVSSVLLFVIYFLVVNASGWAYFHYIL